MICNKHIEIHMELVSKIQSLRDKYHIQATLLESGAVRQKVVEIVLDLEEALK